MATPEESPLVTALPPETDYMSYLTIVEHYLTEDTLPILHRVLQDEKLTTNIGWDLVHLLVPLLPLSLPCLQDIARLGNPREVILKVTESLRLIDYEALDEPEDEGDDASPGAAKHPLKTAPTTDSTDSAATSQAVEMPPPLPLPVSQFTALLSMLATLQNRVKTKYPSRFLSTTLQAILASFSNAVSHREEMVLAIVKTVKAVTGIQRPALPARKSSGILDSINVDSINTSAQAADPEGDPVQEISPEEVAMQTKLLQSFLTHILEEYLLNLSPSDDVPGLGWCTRIMEKLHPDRIIPQTTTLSARFSIEERLHRRIDTSGQLVTLAQDLHITDGDLLSAAIAVEAEAVPSNLGSEDDPPASATDIPLSRIGSLLLYASRQASSVLYDLPYKQTFPIPFDIFPDHHELLKHCLSSPASGTGTLGTEPYALIDGALALALLCLDQDSIGQPSSDEDFNSYLQLTALLSSNCSSPNLRGHAHYLTTTVLRSQPDENVRLAFIRDTLEHCPFENLKVSAVGWIKGETIEANPPRSAVSASEPPPSSQSIFATPLALDSLAPFLFPSLAPDLLSPSLAPDLLSPSILDAYQTFTANLSFYLATLNFLYLLLCARHLHATLAVQDLWKDHDIAASLLQPLRQASAAFRNAMQQGGSLEEDRTDSVLADINVLDEAVERVEKVVRLLNEST